MVTYKVVPFSPIAGLLEWCQVRACVRIHVCVCVCEL